MRQRACDESHARRKALRISTLASRRRTTPKHGRQGNPRASIAPVPPPPPPPPPLPQLSDRACPVQHRSVGDVVRGVPTGARRPGHHQHGWLMWPSERWITRQFVPYARFRLRRCAPGAVIVRSLGHWSLPARRRRTNRLAVLDCRYRDIWYYAFCCSLARSAINNIQQQ